MIKICYVTTVSITVKAFILKSAQYLINTGDYDITIVCSNDEQLKKQIPEGIKYCPINMSRGISFDGINACYQLYKLFKKEHYDIVQYSTPNASFYASIAARLANIPVRLYCQWGIAYVGFNNIKRKIFKLLEKITCVNSTTIEPDSYGNLNFSINEKLYKNYKGHVVGPGSASGVSFTKFNINNKHIWNKKIREEYGIDDDDFVFGFVGRIDKDKGINELLQAFFLLPNDKIKLIIVGSNDKEYTIGEELIKKAKNDSRIIFTGQVGNVEEYMSAMNVFVLPSYREGFGSVVIEAQSMGVPVIVTDIPGPNEAMSENTGIKVPSKDHIALKDAMEKMLNNHELVKKHESNCVDFAKKFDDRIIFDLIDKDRKKLFNIYANKNVL